MVDAISLMGAQAEALKTADRVFISYHKAIRALYDRWMAESRTAPGNEGVGYHNAAAELRDAFSEAWDD